jgi:hypothetical protein
MQRRPPVGIVVYISARRVRSKAELSASDWIILPVRNWSPAESLASSVIPTTVTLEESTSPMAPGPIKPTIQQREASPSQDGQFVAARSGSPPRREPAGKLSEEAKAPANPQDADTQAFRPVVGSAGTASPSAAPARTLSFRTIRKFPPFMHGSHAACRAAPTNGISRTSTARTGRSCAWPRSPLCQGN